MNIQSPPPEPVNTTTNKCDIKILNIRRKILKISPHYWKRNEEFRQSKKKKIRENLKKWLLDDEAIKDFVKQLDNKKVRKEGINADWPAWKYYSYEPVIDKRNEIAYLIIFFLDDNNPELIGVITVYPYEQLQ